MSTTVIKSGLLVWLLTILLTCLTVISACSSSSGDKAPGAIPTAPTNLTYTVQSHEAKLFWTASTDDGLVIGYDIFRDGVLIKELLEANSFSDTMLEPATIYQYSVIAVDDDGNDSMPSNVEVTTLDGAPLSPVINRTNHVELLRHVFDIYTGNAYIAEIATLPDWSDPSYAGFPTTESIETNITCLNGGTARFTPFVRESDHGSDFWEFEFDDCQDDAVVLDGQLHREFRSSSGGWGKSVASSGLSINGQSQQLQYSGTVDEGVSFTLRRSASDVNYYVFDGISSFALSSANTGFINYPAVGGPFMISGAFTVRSDTTDNRPLHAEVLQEIDVWPLSSEWSNSGVLELTGDDGSKLVLNADNGDFQSVAIEISNGDGDKKTFTQPWSLWAEDLRIELGIGD